MKRRLWLDFETRSLLNVKNVGLDNYAKHPSTTVLMLAWAFDNDKPQLWQPRLGPMPQEIIDGINDPDTILCAWNYNFERDIFGHVLNMPTKQNRWYDPSVLCAYMSLPVGLHRAGDALSVSGKKIHIIGDERPVKLFSQPSKATKKMLAAGVQPLYFKDWDSHPEDWQIFCGYCIQDVVSERDVHYAAVALNSPMTDEEYRAWLLDQRMNQAGVYIDQTFVANGKAMAEAEAMQLLAQIKTITGADNPNSRDQLMKWLEPRGYPYNSLDAEHIEEALKLTFLTPEVRVVLELKAKLGGSAYKKFQSIQDRVSPDGRLRDQFVYHGAHTGRWSGRGVQLQNLYKPDKDAGALTDQLVKAIRANDLNVPSIIAAYNAAIVAWNESHPDKKPKSTIKVEIEIMTAIASVIRASFCAAPGNKLVVGDLAQIESRVLAAIAGCKQMIDAYSHGHDLYKEFMSWLLDKPMDQVDSDERARGKVVILGSGFGMGEDKFVDYCATFGITMPRTSEDPNEVTAEKCIQGFRTKYHEIPALWKALDTAVKNAVEFNSVIYVRGLVVNGRNPRCLKIKLPSGRFIHYANPKISMEKNQFSGRKQKTVTYTAYDSKGLQTKKLYGGLLTENVVQAIARDILLNGMFEAEKLGFTIIMTIHDEIAAETAENSELKLEDLLQCMSKCPEWGEGMGFILAAEGYENSYYRK